MFLVNQYAPGTTWEMCAVDVCASESFGLLIVNAVLQTLHETYPLPAERRSVLRLAGLEFRSW